MICGMMTGAGGAGMPGAVSRTGVISVACPSDSGCGSGISTSFGAVTAIFTHPSTSSGITVTGAGAVRRPATFDSGRTFSGATQCRTAGRKPVSPAVSGTAGATAAASFS
jgi:hypothetical protein